MKSLNTNKNCENLFQELLTNSYFQALSIGIITGVITFLFTMFVAHNKDISGVTRDDLMSLIIGIIVMTVVFINSRINKLIKSMTNSEALVHKIERLIDNPFFDNYIGMIEKLKKEQYVSNFTDFIVNITAKSVFKEPLPTLSEIYDVDYRNIIDDAIKNNSIRSLNLILADYPPNYFFKEDQNDSGLSPWQKQIHLNMINELNFNSKKRLMIFDEEDLKNSFNKMYKADKEKFFKYHKKVGLYWITKGEFTVLSTMDSVPDCVLIDNALLLEVKNNVLKMKSGESIKSIKVVFQRLEDDIDKKSVNKKNSNFKDMGYIMKHFENNFKRVANENESSSIN